MKIKLLWATLYAVLLSCFFLLGIYFGRYAWAGFFVLPLALGILYGCFRSVGAQVFWEVAVGLVLYAFITGVLVCVLSLAGWFWGYLENIVQYRIASLEEAIGAAAMLHVGVFVLQVGSQVLGVLVGIGAGRLFGGMLGLSENRVGGRGLIITISLVVLVAFSALSFTQLQDEVSVSAALEKDRDSWIRRASERFWYFYYFTPVEQRFGIDNLTETLSGFNWSITYLPYVFDCSEMSAYLERYLENRGWNATIAVGGDHAWLLVEAEEGTYTPVEATVPEVVQSSSEDYERYFNYEHAFTDIRAASSYALTEFDWWERHGLHPLEEPGEP